MGKAKDIILKPISSQDANKIVRAIHYSHKVVNNSQIHFGAFLDGKCGGAMQFGPSLDKRKIQGLIKGTLWNEFIELNRMAFADWLPRNSESRCIGYAMRWLKKTYPWLKWVVSFADGTQCGDGTIYRASGFVLTGIKQNDQIWVAPDGMPITRMVATDTRIPERQRLLEKAKIFSRMSLTDNRSKQQQQQAIAICRVSATKGGNIMETGGASMSAFKAAGFKPLPGFQLRYIYFLDPTARDRLTVPILPFSEIDRYNARMYKGKRLHADEPKLETDGASSDETGGANPTHPLNLNTGGAPVLVQVQIK